ncbi:UNC-like C-terminal-domain-containing protein [Schizophyllum amplum]|uniref:UNC-like C-terminal-domain-containing protein n=1 Tax=Schizophyllum amplum TaxID=97359 RepID=A0A550CBS4_9AGAR|nr:UNC-like C-terminal-domain-containing protein [Auriculariopsis ampla]
MVALTSLSALILIAGPVFAQTSPNDPLRAIAVAAPPPPEQPICCLVQPTDQEATEEDVLLSFEEWKAKQSAMQQQTRMQGDANRSDSATGSSSPVSAAEADVAGGETNAAPTSESPGGADVAGAGAWETGTEESMSLHFKVPLTDRFNYASTDCSARVHTSHRAAKSAHSILSSKRDRYMLSPCDAKEPQYVVVELCEDIRIDTVQMANFEFFSGVFKDFTVSVAKRYTTDGSEWTVAGTYQAKNVRGVQSFHPPTSLRDFYRYIRIDFHSHYGNEFYCPVSLLRVYGLTHLEQWKWEAWEEESRARLAESSALPVSANADPTLVAEEPQAAASVTAAASSSSASERSGRGPKTPQTGAQPTTGATSPSASATTTADVSHNSTSVLPTGESITTPAAGNDSNAHSTDTVTSLISLPTEGTSITAEYSDNSMVTSITTSITASQNVPTNLNSVSLAPPLAATGESIYRTIMNRLTALEANQTLYVRYFEEQSTGVRDVLRRLTEDVGRLQALGKTQSQNYHRTTAEWDRQRLRLQADYDDLISKVNYLSDEVILEKRLSIAQLCLLLAVLVFLAVTRGSNVDVVHPSPAMRAWGRRKLSMSGHWVMERLRTGRNRQDSDVSQSRERTAQRARDANDAVRKEDEHRARGDERRAREDDTPTEENKGTVRVAFPEAKRRPARLVLSGRSRTPSLRTPTWRHFPGGVATPPRAAHIQWPATVTRAVNIALDQSGGASQSGCGGGRAQAEREGADAESGDVQRPATVQRSSFVKLERPALLLRSNSGGAAVPASSSWQGPPRSSRKWARAAHLHEVRATYARTLRDDGGDVVRDEGGDVVRHEGGEIEADGDGGSAAASKGKGKSKDGEGADDWVDTSESEGDGGPDSPLQHRQARRRRSRPGVVDLGAEGPMRRPVPMSYSSEASLPPVSFQRSPERLTRSPQMLPRSPEGLPRSPERHPRSSSPPSTASVRHLSSYHGAGSPLHGPTSPILPSAQLKAR